MNITNISSPEVPLSERPFRAMGKIARLNRDIIVTEKIDGTNASIHISDDLQTFRVASRTQWITPNVNGKQTDNHGFAAWAYAHRDALLSLGPGSHFGEWWGSGIQRNYGLTEKRFSLFNVGRWFGNIPDVAEPFVSIVPILYTGPFDTLNIKSQITELSLLGSVAAPGFMKPEGVVIYHKASGQLFKVTVEKDEKHKGEN